MGYRNRQESLYPVRSIIIVDIDSNIMSAGHGEQITNGHPCQILIQIGRQFLWKETENRIINLNQTFVNRKTNGCSGKCFTYRPHLMRLFGRFAVIPAFQHHLSVLEHHDAVQVDMVPTLRFSTGSLIKSIGRSSKLRTRLTPLQFIVVRRTTTGKLHHHGSRHQKQKTLFHIFIVLFYIQNLRIGSLTGGAFPAALGIGVLTEVGPVIHHAVTQLIIGLGERTPAAVQSVEHVPQFR